MKYLLLIGFVAFAWAKVPLSKPLSPNTLSNAGCSICKLAINKIEQNITSNETEAQIEQYLDAYCEKLSNKTIEIKLCKSIVHKIVTESIQDIKNNVTADAICQKLNQCPSSTRNVQRSYLNQHLKPRNVKGTAAECSMCNFLVGAAGVSLYDEHFQNKMLKSAVSVCYKLQTKDISKCMRFMNAKGPEIYEIFASKINLKGMCEELNLC